jgi:hypothetical protein
MYQIKIIKFYLLFSAILFVTSCTTEEPLPDKSIGEWQVYSITDVSGNTTVWSELEDTLVELIAEYSCMEFTATITEQIVSTRYVFIDQNSRGCLSPAIAVYTWSVDEETGLYKYVQGTNIINYLITFSNNDNRMTWNDQTSGAITVWDRVVEATVETSE